MTTRFLLLLALTIGLALGSGPISGGHRGEACCCAPLPDATTCCSADESPAQDAPASVPTAADQKQALSPTLHLIGIAPSLTVALPSVRRQFAARHPEPARLALLCTRLI